MRKVSVFLIIIFLFVQFISAQTANPYQAQLTEFEQFVKNKMEADKIPGLSIGFIKDDVIWTKGFGYADLENKIPAKPESMYRMASVTKPMTATAVLQLVEKGKINLDAEVQTYVPYFPKKKFPVTVRQLLGHIGGISHYQNYDKEGHFKDYKNTRQSIAVFENFDLVNEPGTQYFYSSYGYNLLGAVIESASGKSYGEYMTENVWRPLGMTETRLDSPNDIIPNRARGYQLINGQVKNSEFVDISSRFSAGGVRSNVIEMLKFAKGMNENKVLSKASKEMMFDTMQTKSGQLTYYGMGWGTFPLNGQYVVSHSGSQQETITVLYNFPNKNLIIAVAINLEDADRNAFAGRLFEAITGETWLINSYIADRNKLGVALVMQGIFEEGRSHFERTQKPFSDNPTEAFAIINQYANAETFKNDGRTARTKLNEARNPIGGQQYAKIGSFMANKLKESGANLADYSTTGSVGFFADYIALYQKDSRIPKEFRFNESFEQTAIALNESWKKTNTKESRSQNFNANTDFDAVGAKYRTAFANGEIYPNYANQLNDLARNLFLGGNAPKALKAGQLAVDLYPNLENVNTTQGLLLTFTGNKEKGKEFLKKANEINPRGEASGTGLNRLAYQLRGTGLIDAGLEVLKIAIELHPTDANLFDSLGEFYAEKGTKDKAIEFYKKALEINPTYPNAEKAKETLKKLEGSK